MRFSNLIPLFVISVVADIASYDPELGQVVHYFGIGERAVNCKVVNGALSALKGLGGPATSFCSSYLSIGTATVTNTFTPPPTLVTVVSTVSTVTVTAVNKRTAPKPVPIPAVLKGYVAAELTSACKCLNIPSQTAQATVTAPTPVNTFTALTTFTTTATTCAANGQHCDCFRPDLCCGQACFCTDNGVPVSTCISF